VGRSLAKGLFFFDNEVESRFSAFFLVLENQFDAHRSRERSTTRLTHPVLESLEIVDPTIIRVLETMPKAG